ncbi:MAG: aldose epimerase family protein [Pseudomonadota bacterium]
MSTSSSANTARLQTFVIKGDSGLQVTLADFGARVLDISLPLQKGLQSVTCGYEQPQDFLTDRFYMGATVGPIANRVANGQLSIQGQQVQLDINQGPNSLHSGAHGYDDKQWQCVEQSPHSVTFELNVPNSDNPLPGNLNVRVRYTVEDRNLNIDYRAQTDEASYLNLTNHVYLNLNTEAATIHNHRFVLHAKTFAEVDDLQIPNGSCTKLCTPFRYSINALKEPAALTHHADHHFIVDENDAALKHCLKALSPESGIELDVFSTKPGFQLYTGQFLGDPFVPYQGFCVETQFAPDAINQTGFISPLTTPDQPYRHTSCYRFNWPS